MNDYNAVKDSLTVFLTSARINAEMLKNIPHGMIGDMAEVVCMETGERDGRRILRTVTYAEIKAWGISPDLLRADAERNTALKKPAELKPLVSVLSSMIPVGPGWESERTGWEVVEVDRETENPDWTSDKPGREAESSGWKSDKAARETEGPVQEPNVNSMELLVATNGEGSYGAAVITYPGFLRKIAGRLGGDFYLIPSSIHEVLVFRADHYVDESSLTEMVREVNRREVLKEERLSDFAYRYDAESGILLKIA